MKTLLTTMAVIATTATSALAWDANTTQDELRAQIAEGNNVIMLQELANADPTNADAEILFRENQADYYTSYGREDGYIRDQIASAQRRLDYLVRIAEIPPELRNWQAYRQDALTIMRNYGEAPLGITSAPFYELSGHNLADFIENNPHSSSQVAHLMSIVDPIERGLYAIYMTMSTSIRHLSRAESALATGDPVKSILEASIDKLESRSAELRDFSEAYEAAYRAWNAVEITLDPATVQRIITRTPTD